MRKILTTLFLLSIGLITNAQDDLLVHEPFDYAKLNPLNWAENNEEGWTGEWIRSVGDDIIIRENNLDYNGWASNEGNHLAVDIDLVGSLYNRSITNIPDTGQVIWSSVLVDFKNGTNPNSVGNITFTKNGSQVFSFGKKYGNQKIGIAWENVGGYNTNINASGLHWLVVKIQFSGNNSSEEAWLWVDPPTDVEPQNSSADLAVPQSGLPNLSINFGIDGVQVKAQGETPIFMDMDEFRLGKTFNSVNPFFQTSVLEIVSIDDFKIFPNPTSENITIQFQNKKQQDFSTRVLSLDGKIILQTNEEKFPEGQNKKELNLQNLNINAGMYIIQLVGMDGVISKKFFFVE